MELTCSNVVPILFSVRKIQSDVNMTRFARKVGWEIVGVVLDRPLQSGEVWAPKNPRALALDGGSVVWNLLAAGVRSVSPGAGMLDAFTQLHSSPDEAILRFARKWGTMQFCQHGLPHFHCSTNVSSLSEVTRRDTPRVWIAADRRVTFDRAV